MAKKHLRFAATVVVALGGVACAQASILPPAPLSFDEASLLAESDGADRGSLNGSANAGTPASRRGSELPAQDESGDSEQWFVLGHSANGGGPSSTSSTSSSCGGAASPAVCPTDAATAFRDDSRAGQVAHRRDLFLPDPPGTDLLRPPRV